MLKTSPVGPRGVVTMSGWGVPAPLYSVATFAPLSDIQKGLIELDVIPQGFLRFGSVFVAIPGMSETRLVCINESAEA
jgi:hypothetical protein